MSKCNTMQTFFSRIGYLFTGKNTVTNERSRQARLGAAWRGKVRHGRLGRQAGRETIND